MADENTNEDGAEAPEKSGGGLVKMLVLGLGLIVVMIVTQLGTIIVAKSMLPDLLYPEWMMALAPEPEEEEPKPEPPAPPVYTKIDPSFVVSYQTDSSVRFLQIQIEAMARDEESIAAFETHSPRIRNDLLMLFASESLDELATREGKEKVRQKAFEQINEILEKESPGTQIEDLYFTSFVVQ